MLKSSIPLICTHFHFSENSFCLGDSRGPRKNIQKDYNYVIVCYNSVINWVTSSKNLHLTNNIIILFVSQIIGFFGKKLESQKSSTQRWFYGSYWLHCYGSVSFSFHSSLGEWTGNVCVCFIIINSGIVCQHLKILLNYCLFK